MGRSSTPNNAALGIDGLPEYRRSQLPPATDWKNRQIVIVEASGDRAVWFSDGAKWAGAGGGAGVTNATAAEIAALALAGTLTPGGIYFDSAMGIF